MLLSGVRWDGLPEQIITRSDELAACCEHLAARRLFGFDTEFVGEDSYHPRLCLVQVATPDRLYLIDPLAEDIGPLDAFWKLVVDPANQVVVHAGREEAPVPALDGANSAALFDLQPAAGLIGMVYPLGYGPLVNQFLGVSMSKGETLTEWRSRPLTRAQVRYAFDDVRYLLPIWDRLRTALDDLGRLDWRRRSLAAWHRWPCRGRGAGEVAETARPRLTEPPAAAAVRNCTAGVRRRRADQSAVAPSSATICWWKSRRKPSKERDLHVRRGLPKRDLPAILRVVEKCEPCRRNSCRGRSIASRRSHR
jgi:ribonuclease D